MNAITRLGYPYDPGDLFDIADQFSAEEDERAAQEAAYQLMLQQQHEQNVERINQELREAQTEWAGDPRAQEEYRRWQIETLTQD